MGMSFRSALDGVVFVLGGA
ncbi:hypothetical protein A2U01_0086039, partial [Trifolium medium]|nr:hypothetical protein [Trifolium medium]